MGEDYDVTSNNSDENNGDKSGKFDQSKAYQDKIVSVEAAPPAMDSANKKSSPNKTTAVPLMSIPTPALSYRKSFDRSNQVLNFMLSSRQNQIPLLGSPQQNLGPAPHLIANGNSDTSLSRGLSSAPKIYGVPPDLYNNFAPVAAQTAQQLPSRHSLPAMSQSLDTGAHQFAQQYSNWPVMYPQIPQPGIQFVPPPQQQPFLPQPVSGIGTNGVVPAAQYQNFSQAVLQGNAFYHPSAPTTR